MRAFNTLKRLLKKKRQDNSHEKFDTENLCLFTDFWFYENLNDHQMALVEQVVACVNLFSERARDDRNPTIVLRETQFQRNADQNFSSQKETIQIISFALLSIKRTQRDVHALWPFLQFAGFWKSTGRFQSNL